MSVRTKPTRDEIKQAETIYQAMNADSPPRIGVFSRIKKSYKNAGLKVKLVMLSMIVAIVLATGGYEEYHEMTAIGDSWTNYQDNVVKRLTLTNEITSAFGYGGIIHQFKDYELKQNDIYHDAFLESYSQLLKSVELYKQIPDINSNELTALTNILRIKNALDNVTANVMVVDSQRSIIYMNGAVQETLENAEASIKQDLPNFSVNNLLGNNLDTFDLRPLFQRQTLQELTGTHKAEITLGGRVMDITLNPVLNASKERLGTAIEWVDKTAEVAIEKEIDALVAAASMATYQNGYQWKARMRSLVSSA